MDQFELTEKERIFCIQYCTHYNGSRAAREAGYSEKSARDIAKENLTKPHIQDAIKWIKSNVAEAAGISALRNAMELAKIAYGNISDFKSDWNEHKAWDEIPEDAKAAIQEISTTTLVTRITNIDEDAGIVQKQERQSVKVKQYDKLKALEILNRMYGFNAPDEISNSVTYKVSFKKNADKQPDND